MLGSLKAVSEAAKTMPFDDRADHGRLDFDEFYRREYQPALRLA